MNIRKRFVIFSILLGIVPTLIATSICITNLKNRNIEIIKQNLITAANDQSTHLEAFFEQNVSNLNIIADMPITKELLIDSNNKVNSTNIQYDREIVDQLLNGQKNGGFFLSRISLINKDGVITASSDEVYIDKDTVLSTIDMEKLINNKMLVTDVIERKDFNNGVKSVIIASPIFFNNEYQGAMLSVVDMSYFERLVDDIMFFKSGKVAIMDNDGTVVASSSEQVKYNINTIDSPNNLYTQWKNIDFEKNPNGIIDYNINGIDKIGCYFKVGDIGWTVLTGVEWDEFKAPLNQNIRNIIILLLFIIVIATIAYIFVINHFFKPLFKLLESIKRIKQGNYSDRFIYNKDNEFGEIATAFNELIDRIEKNKKHIENKNRELQSLASNIPGGVHRNIIRDGEHILDFLSGGCLNLLGYKRHEFKKVFGKKILDVIYEKDRERVEKEIIDQIDKHNRFTVEYRVKRKDGSIIWLLDSGKIVKDRDGKILSYNVVINITDAKIAQEELRLSEERYRIIMSQTEDIIFQWDVAEDTISFSDNWKSKFNYESTINDITKKIYKTKDIYKDDMRKLSKSLSDIVRGKKYVETEIRIRKNDNKYVWYRVRATAMFDENGNVCRVIGVIIDINKEKIETERLLFKAQRDSLTELYNKATVQNMIEEYINGKGIDGNHALFIIDIDDFKSINDNLGHLFGDSVLSNVSSMFLNVFGENAIIGRIGGDEFIIFLKNIDSDDVICEKANNLIEGFKTSFTGENLNYKVSGSIGIAKYPKNGQTFNELFANADRALYLAKGKGKDNYHLLND